MFESDDPKTLRCTLEYSRSKFLRKLRGRSDVYDGVRMRAAKLARATGASETIVVLIEAVLIEQHTETAAECGAEHAKELAAVRQSEHMRVRLALEKALAAAKPPG